ncbi:SET domain-containing protein [Lindgomyces ingoldianus]|uniref:SET domain-containing protein n=1 Tax=Lindgomyces ingoldianus TaxID=673940 RepID=A0ACB6QSZ0_9PLEO|nr:SET domain-containing protein [Lindgomyces ingoldianus]KAF2470099.1 SET domain-containing protein [Lindgomyces ingoldianus]
MIRRGRAEGWLRQPIDALPAWAEFHGVTFNGTTIGQMSGFEQRGSTVIATRDLRGGKEDPLIMVPKDLILSRQTVDIFAKSDRHLKEVLDAVGDFGYKARGAILIFLLMQATISCPDIKDIGVLNPFNEYIKFLPDELLPTFWTEEEQELLVGTTLRAAVRAKLNSLLREFDAVRTATESIDWCAKNWWDEEEGQLTFEDWMRLDAMYRSRALEFPGVGDCMVPCVDMANHASGDATAALYETDDSGSGLLLLQEGKEIQKDGEVTITYGDDKGACENIFSYGFLEETMMSAKVMFLDLDIPAGDPLRPAKIAVANVAPGVRIFEKDGHTAWESDFIWLVAVNEEDGLGFKLRQTIDGQKDIQAFWKDHELTDTSKLRELLQADPLWDVYQLRAIILLQNRVRSQLQLLRETGNPERDVSIREGPWQLAGRLRSLESEMLEMARDDFEDQKGTLLQSEVVKHYLGLSEERAEEGEEEVDFS